MVKLLVPTSAPTPYWSTTDGKTVRLYLGHVLNRLRDLPASSVHCVVTSPPYWGLRSYLEDDHEHKELELGSEYHPDCSIAGSAKCGERFVCHMTQVFREVKRVLRPDGLLFLNLGDTYGGSLGGARGGVFENGRTDGKPGDGGKQRWAQGHGSEAVGSTNLSPGNLVGVPWRVALALQADGWILRQDVIWRKPSPMPESVTNRCTKAHEYIFVFTKQQDYYADMEAVKEKAIRAGDIPGGDYNNRDDKPSQVFGRRIMADGSPVNSHPVPENRNKRSVWSINEETALYQWLEYNAPELLGQFLLESQRKDSVWTFSGQGYKGAHFATFPKSLVETCLKIGTSEAGCCAKCGAPWRRLAQERMLTRQRPNDYVKRTGEEGTGNSCANTVAGVDTKTLGWVPTCHCSKLGLIKDAPRAPKESNGKPPTAQQKAIYKAELVQWTKLWESLKPQYEKLPRTPCVILDPFVGSGTSCDVALSMKLHSIGIDLNQEYLDKHAIPRIEGILYSRPALSHLIPRRQPLQSKPGK